MNADSHRPMNSQWGQIILFGLLFVGYTLYTMTRQSLSYNIPNIKLQKDMDSEEIGTLTSTLALGYAIGKFFSGILVDHVNPRHLFSIGLCICGAINIAFSSILSVQSLSVLWLANGLFQGFGWPSCAKMLKRSYSPSLFGTMWSLLSASMNVAASVGPILSNNLMDVYGSWRTSMRLFGSLAMAAGIICFLFVNDSKQSESHNTSRDGGDKMDKPNLRNALTQIFQSPVLYIMSLGFLGCLLCKGVMSDWVPLYLITEKNATREMAASFITAFQIGGIFGNLSSGAITDWIKRRSQIKERGTPRNYLLIPLVALLETFVFVLCNYFKDMSNQYAMVLAVAFAIGYSLYSLISTIGITVVEISESTISGTSHAVAALFGNLGLILSGFPFAKIVENYSWSTAFLCLEGVLVAWFCLAVASQYIKFKIGTTKTRTQ